VISAGGTTLALAVAVPLPSPLQLNYGSESAWFGSTGGISTIEPQPSWQNPACAAWSTTNRCTPDIASDANSIPGLPVYDSFSGPGWQHVGGTSAAAPDWASFFALVNSLRLAAGKNTLSQAASDLYTIYYSDDYAHNFHDITSGNNGGCGSECNAGPGYDLVTGVGTYQANRLYAQLVATPN
jgi:subtilase family serine protease